MRKDTDIFEARRSKLQLLLLFALSLVFLLISLWMIGVFGSIPTTRRSGVVQTFLVGAIGTLFAGSAGIAILRKLLDPGVVLRIDRDGLYYREWSDHVIPWSQINHIEELKVANQRMTAVHLVDPSRFPGKGIVGYLSPTNRSMAFGDFCIVTTGTNRKIDGAIDAIDRLRT